MSWMALIATRSIRSELLQEHQKGSDHFHLQSEKGLRRKEVCLCKITVLNTWIASSVLSLAIYFSKIYCVTFQPSLNGMKLLPFYACFHLVTYKISYWFPGPSAPLNFLVQINPALPRQLILSWKEPTSFSDSIRRYEIYQSIEKAAWEKNEVAGATMKLNVTSTRPGSEYRFKIRAHDAITWGPFTDVSTLVSMDGE